MHSGYYRKLTLHFGTLADNCQVLSARLSGLSAAGGARARWHYRAYRVLFSQSIRFILVGEEAYRVCYDRAYRVYKAGARHYFLVTVTPLGR